VGWERPVIGSARASAAMGLPDNSPCQFPETKVAMRRNYCSAAGSASTVDGQVETMGAALLKAWRDR
jgi:hypothetical protein